MTKKCGVEFVILSANGKQEPPALTNNKQEHALQQIQADNARDPSEWGSH
jgi:hypothetical protein